MKEVYESREFGYKIRREAEKHKQGASSSLNLLNTEKQLSLIMILKNCKQVSNFYSKKKRTIHSHS